MFSGALSRRKKLIDVIGVSFDEKVVEAANLLTQSVDSGGTLFFAGNGGSAAEAQHMSAEYLATLDHRNFRPGIKAMALTVDTSFITAWTNDFGYEEVFSRQLETFGQKGDVFIAYSTSGTSKNIVKALTDASESGILTVGFTGNDGGVMAELCDVCFVVPSASTAMIQEIHTMLGHEICGLVEKSVAK